MSLFDRFRKRIGLHVHERELFLVGCVAFVKCVTCGAESLPWSVPLSQANASKADHAGDVDKLVKIEKRIKEQQI